MVTIRIDTGALRRKASDLRYSEAKYLGIVHTALRTAAQDKLDRIAAATPVGIVVRDGDQHVHMADRWSLGESAEGVSFENPAPYAGFVGKEPEDAYGARVEAHYNQELRAELDTIEEDIRYGMEAELADTLRTL